MNPATKQLHTVGQESRATATFHEGGRRDQSLTIPVTPHGTWDRWRLHIAMGEEPCASCAVACADYWAARMGGVA